MRTAQREYQRRVRIGYHGSTEAVRITIPDSINIPSQTVWVWFNDHRTIVVSPNPPSNGNKGAIQRTLFRQEKTPGCRELNIPEVKRIGPPFGQMNTSFRVDGQHILIDIPSEDQRKAPKSHGGQKVSVPVMSPEQVDARVDVTLAAKSDIRALLAKQLKRHSVMVEYDGVTVEFEVPRSELDVILDHWREKGFEC